MNDTLGIIRSGRIGGAVARLAHPWTGWTFSAGWELSALLDAVLVQPDVLMATRGV
ncbi:hypothetical protein ACH4HG_29685 [Streptomyces coeruleorubidus]|uniref:hypothetical protein n=1 Tax=Streptomyces coeruleorubidus TaxID=116188 RepID=UPI00378BBB21